MRAWLIGVVGVAWVAACEPRLPVASPFAPCEDAGDARVLPVSAEQAEAGWAEIARCAQVEYQRIDCALEWWSGQGRCEPGSEGCEGLYACEMCPASGRHGHDNECDHGGTTAGEGAR